MKEFLEQLRTSTLKKSLFLTIIALALFSVIGSLFNPILALIGFIVICIYIGITLYLIKNDGKKNPMIAETGAILGITLDFVVNHPSPTVITDDAGMIIWYNKAFTQTSGIRSSLYGKSLSETVSELFTPQRIEQLKSGAIFPVIYNEKEYEVSGCSIQSAGKNYCMMSMDDRTELLSLRRSIEERNSVVAFVMLDNISESMQFAQEKYRNVSASIAGLLSDWGKKYGGIVKEYERDKYIAVFEKKQFAEILAAKFDILDSIRETEIDGAITPITASIGVSDINGTLAEKEAASRSALELALQRGGDQAVFKTAGSTEYYGGKTKTVQKKNKIRSRVFAGELCSLIRQCDNVIIMGHKFSDYDSIASCIAVSRIARHFEKPVKIAVSLHDTNLKPVFSMLRGKSNYTDVFCDPMAAQELIGSGTLLIICDVNNPALFESRELYDNCISYVIIDHHRKVQEEYALAPKLSYIEPSASSASELMTEILEYAIPDGTLSQVEAELLLSGIILDTDNFRKNTGTKTFSAALSLRSYGADPGNIVEMFKTSYDEFIYESSLEDNIYSYKENILISTGAQNIENISIAKIVTSKAADRLLGIAGTAATFVIAPVENNVNISARSHGTINVQLIMEALGGGGHYDSAGTFLKETTVEEARKMLEKAIDDTLEEMKNQKQQKG